MPRQKPHRSKQNYRTPPEFLQAVKSRLQIPYFECDLACEPGNEVAELCYHESDNSLDPSSGWVFGGHKWAFLNPPYANIAPWAEKAKIQSLAYGAHIAMLVPASVGSNWWLRFVEPYAYQVFLNGRLTFPPETSPYPKDLALLLYTPWGFTGHEIWTWENK